MCLFCYTVVRCCTQACWLIALVTPPAISELSIVMSMSVCLCLSVRDHIFGTTRPIFTKFSVRVTYGRDSVPLWRRSDTLRISGSMDDVICACRLRQQRERSLRRVTAVSVADVSS